MTAYLVLKTVHVVSATILFGTGLGTAFFKWIVDRSGSVPAIRVVSEKVVLADWLFTTPALIVQALTGIALAVRLGYPLTRGWLAYAVGLYLLAGACWLPVVWLQIRMRALARECDRGHAPLPDRYWRYARAWFRVGVPAFGSLLVIFWLMVFRPT